ncbi:hypothetical protein ABZS29_17615 [Kribbella sp. NPDC005582]
MPVHRIVVAQPAPRLVRVTNRVQLRVDQVDLRRPLTAVGCRK